MFPVGNALKGYYPPQKAEEIAALPIGDTVMAGTDVVDESKIRKVPVLYNPEYIVENFKEGKYTEIFIGLLTGAINTPIENITGGSISIEGTAQNYTGPGLLTIKNNQLVVDPPGTFVWGYKTPYTTATKTKNGIEIKNVGKTLKVVSANDISNNTIPTKYVSATNVKSWYDNADVGESITLDYSLTYFNDGRNLVPPDEILNFFGTDTITYMENYPSGSPVMVYNSSTKEDVAGTSASVLESFPEYGDSGRELNARQFVKAWNNTIIPPQGSSHGKETVEFYGLLDKNVSGTGTVGYVTHGVCPPGRAFRDAIMAAGFSMPSGMNSGEYCVNVDSEPATGILVRNTGKYPIKIVMYTSGTGPSMVMYAKVIELIP
jgi:hypothetical protein